MEVLRGENGTKYITHQLVAIEGNVKWSLTSILDNYPCDFN